MTRYLVETQESLENMGEAQILKQQAQQGAQTVLGGIPVASEVQVLRNW